MNAPDVQQMILDELRQIKTEVRLIPKLQAMVDTMSGSSQQMEMAMRETTAALQMQASAHSKLIDEVRLQVHQTTAAMMGLSNDLQAHSQRIKDLERQTVAAFQQQQMLARDVRESACFPDPEEYRDIKAEVETLPALREDVKTFKKHLPWLEGIEWFLRILFYALGSAGVGALLWLLGRALTGAL